MSTLRIASRCARLIGLTSCGLAAAALSHAEPACRTASQGSPPKVIELYTSEGCSSCPPAEKWLSSLKGVPGILAFAFHVDYFNSQAWRDRFSSAAFTRRQKDVLGWSGASAIYTPQILIDGRDRRKTMGDLAAPTQSVQVQLNREQQGYRAEVSSTGGQSIRVQGFWAVTMNGLFSHVGGGENSGARLEHDFVVLEYRKISEFELKPGQSTTLTFDPSGQQVGQELSLVIVDALNGRPVQAARVSC